MLFNYINEKKIKKNIYIYNYIIYNNYDGLMLFMFYNYYGQKNYYYSHL